MKIVKPVMCTLLFVLAASLLALVWLAPAPIVLSESSQNWVKATLIVLLLLTLVIAMVSRKVATFFQGRVLPKWSIISLLMIPVLAVLSMELLPILQRVAVAFPVFLVLLAGTAFVFALPAKACRAGGGLSFLFLIGLIFSAEVLFDSVNDELLIPTVRKTPQLAARDRSEKVYDTRGYRGKHPCRECPDKLIRIVSMGGSSTYGIPMYYSIDTYPMVLQRLLNERRPFEKYEVLNGGIAGHGLMQILHSLKTRILDIKPDIVTFNCWFNDSSAAPGWYGVPAKSDKDAYAMLAPLWLLQDWRPYRLIHDTRLFALTRHYLINAKRFVSQFMKPDVGIASAVAGKKGQPIRRMSPQEFRWGLEQVVKMGKDHDFQPVFILEPMNRSRDLKKSLKRNRYYRVMTDVAEEFGVPLVDPLQPISQGKDEWLFYDFIHPNPDGHRVIAEEIFQTIFETESPNQEMTTFLKSRGVDVSLPSPERKPFFQLPRQEKSATLELALRAPFQAGFEIDTIFSLNGSVLKKLETVGPELARVTLDIPQALSAPILDLEITSLPRNVQTLGAFKVGDTGVSSPVFLEVISGGRDHGWQVSIRADGKRVDANSRGFNLVVLNSKSGHVELSKGYDLFAGEDAAARLYEDLEMLAKTKSLDPLIVILAVKTDGFHHLDPERFSELLSSFGGKGVTPQAFESYAFIGVTGAKAGTAIDVSGAKQIELLVGYPKLQRALLLEVSEVTQR